MDTYLLLVINSFLDMIDRNNIDRQLIWQNVNQQEIKNNFVQFCTIFQINHKCRFTPVKDDCEQTIQVSSRYKLVYM